MPGQRLSAHKRVVGLLLLVIVLAGLIVTCQSTSTETGPFTPPYLRLRLCGGKAQLQWSGSSEWTAMEGEISIEGSGQIVADAVEGARFCLGDGSTLELAPEVTIEVRNPRVFPRLQVVLQQDGSLLFEAQNPSYEFVVPVCSVTLLSVPSRLKIEVSGETTHLMVEEGAVACAMEEETLTLLECWEMYAVAGKEPEVSEYCAASATAAAPTTTLRPSPTRWEVEPTATPTPSSTPSPTPTPTLTPTPRRVIPTPTPTPIPPTDTPPPQPPPPTKPPPPTAPPPTNTPAPPPTEPPPTPTTSMKPTTTPSS